MSITVSISEVWLERYGKIAEGNQSRLDTLKRLWDACEAQAIPILPLKGMDLILRAYSGYGHRPMHDIDLLVDRKHASRLPGELRKLGFQPKASDSWALESFYDEEAEYDSEDGCSPDRGTVPSPVQIAEGCGSIDVSLGFWYRESMDSVWLRVQKRSTPLGERPLLHPEDALLYFIAYIVAHRGRLSSLFAQDLRVFLEREKGMIDWDRWVSEARRYRLEVPVYHGLRYYAASEQATQIPEAVLAALAPKSLAGRGLLAYYEKAVTERQRPTVTYLFPLLTTPGWPAKRRLAQRILFPPASVADLRGYRPQREGKRSMVRLAAKGFQLLARMFVVIPREIFQLFT